MPVRAMYPVVFEMFEYSPSLCGMVTQLYDCSSVWGRIISIMIIYAHCHHITAPFFWEWVFSFVSWFQVWELAQVWKLGKRLWLCWENFPQPSGYLSLLSLDHRFILALQILCFLEHSICKALCRSGPYRLLFLPCYLAHYNCSHSVLIVKCHHLTSAVSEPYHFHCYKWE